MKTHIFNVIFVHVHIYFFKVYKLTLLQFYFDEFAFWYSGRVAAALPSINFIVNRKRINEIAYISNAWILTVRTIYLYDNCSTLPPLFVYADVSEKKFLTTITWLLYVYSTYVNYRIYIYAVLKRRCPSSRRTWSPVSTAMKFDTN